MIHVYCVNNNGAPNLTVNKAYELLSLTDGSGASVIDDNGNRDHFLPSRFNTLTPSRFNTLTAMSVPYSGSLARSNDPATSKTAITKAKAETIRNRVLAYIKAHTWAAGTAISEGTGIRLNSVTPRLAELCRAGLIHASPQPSNGRETIWVIGPKPYVA